MARRTQCSPGSSHDRERHVALSIATEHLQWGIRQLLSSRRWRLGKMIGNLWRRLTLRRSVPLADEFIEDTLQRLEPLLQPTIPPPIPQRSTELAIYEDMPVDIVICVKDAEKYVRRCLRSLSHTVTNPGKWILVDDASGASCQTAIDTFCESEDRPIVIRRHQSTRGYTVSANEGLQLAQAPHVLLLNSDTELTPQCIPKMLRAFEVGGPTCAAVGALSNAASWQSVPLLTRGTDWATNPLPFGWTAADMSQLVHQSGEPRYPQVPLLNGFCLMLDRQIWNRLEGFDEKAFPRGYGEEDDFCLRAGQQGHKLLIADDAFVYHAKTKSFSSDERSKLVKRGAKQLRRIHGNRLSEAVQAMKHASPLTDRRHAIQTALLRLTTPAAEEHLRPRLMFVLPVSGGGGGAHSIVQEAAEMRHLGLPTQVAVPAIHRSKYLGNYPDVDRDVFFFYRDEEELLDQADTLDIAIATIFHSVPLVKQLHACNKKLLTGYYIQDYEPFFFDWDSKPWRQARDSYESLREGMLFAKTDWLCDTVEQHHGICVERVCAGIDHNIFFPPVFASGDASKVKIAAMVRPTTPRRGPLRTLSIMEQLHQDFGDGIEIHLFGATSSQLSELVENQFPYVSDGVLARTSVGNLMRQMDIFVDFSDYQAFGRAALEAMACGCAVIVPKEGGCEEYAVDKHNCLSITTRETNACLMATRRLIVERELREKIAAAGIETAKRYTVREAALSELKLIERHWKKVADSDPSTQAERNLRDSLASG